MPYTVFGGRHPAMGIRGGVWSSVLEEQMSVTPLVRR
jgi:hypothetical protein